MNTALKFPPHPEEPDPQPPQRPKRRHRGWRIFGWSVLGLICLLIAALVVLGALIDTDGVHTAILNFADKQASKALGVDVNLQNFVLHWGTLSLDVYGVRVDGAGAHPAPPLLQLQHAEVGVRIVSLIHRKWYLSSLRLDKPVVWIYVDKNGKSNLPTLHSSSSSSSNNTLFDLGVRHAVLEGGQVYYNDQPKAMEADLHNLNLRAAYDAPRERYSGDLAYSDGHLKYGSYNPIPHDLSVSFALTPTAFQVPSARLSVGNSQVLISATVSHYHENPAVQVDYHVAIDAAQMGQFLGKPTLPAGVLRAAGDIYFNDVPNQPLMKTLTVNGDLSSDRLAMKSSTMATQVTNLDAHYTVANGNAALRDFHAGVLGGEVTAQGTMTNLGGDSHSSFKAALRNISLAQLKGVAGKSAATPAVALAGTLNATATASWGKTMNDLVARADAGIHGDVSGTHKRGESKAPAPSSSANANLMDVANTTPENANAGVIPVDSEIHATYTRADGRLQLVNSYVRTRQTTLTLNGTVSKNSSLAIRLQANDLRELGTMMNSLRTPAPNQQPLELAGTASFAGDVTGSTAAPHLTGQFTAMHLHLNQSDWKSIHAGVDASPDHASLQNAVLQPATQGSITVNARAGLKKWAFSKQSPLQAQVSVAQIQVADVAKFMTNPPPVTGTLNSHINLHGSLANPEGTGNLALTKVSAYQQPINAIRAQFSGNGQQAQANLSVQMQAGAVQAKVTVQPRQRTYQAEVTSPGIKLDQLAAVQARGIKASGVVQLHASGQGSLDNPALQASVQIPTLTVSNQTINAINLQLGVADHVANATLSSNAMNTNIQAKARMQMTGGYMTDASLDTSVLNLQPLLAIYSPTEAQNIRGQTQVHATVHGPVKNIKQLEAHITIPVLNVAYQSSIQLAEAAPIQVNYKDGVLDVPPGAIRGTDTDLQFQAHVPTDHNVPMSLKLGGTVDLKLAELFNPDIHSGGQMKLNIDSHGAISNGQIGGEIDIVNASFAEGTMPVGLQNGNGVLKLTTDRVNIASFQGTVGGGTVQLQGGVAYRPSLTFDLGMAAKGIRMLYPQGLRESMDANIRLNGSTTNALVAGNVDLTDLSFTPGFDLTSFAGSLSGGVAMPPTQGMAQNVRLNLAVHSTNNIDLVSRQLSVNGAANLQVRGTAAQPVILGRVNLTSGDFIINGNRFLLSGGTIQFINPMQTEPVLNLTLTTTIQEYNISMRFQGPAQQIHAEYSSDPALPTADIIHLLAFGNTTEAAANNATPANQQAEALVASQVSSQVTSRISKVAGISQLSVSPVLQSGTNQGPPGAMITIRQRVTGNLFITFSTNVASTQDQVIQGEYQVSPRVSFSATRDPNGGFGFDTLIKHSW